MRAADAAAAERFGIETMQLMEVAGVQTARLAAAFLQGAAGRAIAVVAGPGHNGGDALVAARHLWQRDATVSCWVMGAPDRLSALTRHQLEVAQRLGIDIQAATARNPVRPPDLIIDGVLGTGIHPPLRDPARSVVTALNSLRRPVLAVDLPSGLDADTGGGGESCVRATITLTLGLPKPGLLHADGVGRLYLADIGLPPQVFGVDAAAVRRVYAQGDLLELVAE